MLDLRLSQCVVHLLLPKKHCTLRNRCKKHAFLGAGWKCIRTCISWSAPTFWFEFRWALCNATWGVMCSHHPVCQGHVGERIFCRARRACGTVLTACNSMGIRVPCTRSVAQLSGLMWPWPVGLHNRKRGQKKMRTARKIVMDKTRVRRSRQPDLTRVPCPLQRFAGSLDPEGCIKTSYVLPRGVLCSSGGFVGAP